MNTNPLFAGSSFTKSKTLQFRPKISQAMIEPISQEGLNDPKINLPKRKSSELKKLSFKTVSTVETLPSPVLNDSEAINKPKTLQRSHTNCRMPPRLSQTSFMIPSENYLSLKKHRTTMTSIFNPPPGKILHTDFWSNNMKREALKIGGVNALMSFKLKNSQKSKGKQKAEADLPLPNIFMGEPSSSLMYERRKNTRRAKSTDLSSELNFIIGRCDHSHELNSKLRQDISKTGKLLKKECKSMFSTNIF